MRRDSLFIGITTIVGVIVSLFTFTVALAYLQIPKEIPIPKEKEIPTPKEIEIPTIQPKKPQKTAKYKKNKEEEEDVIKEEDVECKKVKTSRITPYYSRLIKNKEWIGTKTAKIAIILDDIGYSINGTTKRLLEIQAPLTFSILPGLKYSKQIANLAHEKGLEVMLHMPMENCCNSRMTAEDKLCDTNHNMNPYKYAILTRMSKQEVEEEIESAINDIPYIVGINNHMGSKATADELVMSYVLDKVKEKNLYFIDSITANRSVAYKLAKRKGVLTNKRSVFLDNINNPEYVKERISELIYRAKRNGYAIGIGHGTKGATAEVLAEIVPKLKDYGIEIVPVSKLVE